MFARILQLRQPLRPESVPIALADRQRRVREIARLAGMVGVEVADADDVDVFRPDADLGKLVDQPALERLALFGIVDRLVDQRIAHARVPQQHLVALADQVAAADQRPRPGRILKRVREPGPELLHDEVAAVEPP